MAHPAPAMPRAVGRLLPPTSRPGTLTRPTTPHYASSATHPPTGADSTTHAPPRPGAPIHLPHRVAPPLHKTPTEPHLLSPGYPSHLQSSRHELYPVAATPHRPWLGFPQSPTVPPPPALLPAADPGRQLIHPPLRLIASSTLPYFLCIADHGAHGDQEAGRGLVDLRVREEQQRRR
ncbi:hypothetical protein VPH35_104827 [Triticum aestivum]